MVSATENALISTRETPLAVAWAWVCFSPASLLSADHPACVRGLQVETRAAGYLHRNQTTEVTPLSPCSMLWALRRSDQVGRARRLTTCKETQIQDDRV